mmetsp:Transcript_55780/g.118664  ORF Transcript_55780/g.118664 Transcript_55780/m.118664 type:complete len:101 (+) Transcript_55780:1-303(+)
MLEGGAQLSGQPQRQLRWRRPDGDGSGRSLRAGGDFERSSSNLGGGSDDGRGRGGRPGYNRSPRNRQSKDDDNNNNDNNADDDDDDAKASASPEGRPSAS